MTQTYPFWLPHLSSPTSVCRLKCIEGPRTNSTFQILVSFIVGSSFPAAWFLDSLSHEPSDPSLTVTYLCVAAYVGLSYLLQKEQLQLTLQIGEWSVLATAILGAASVSIPLEVASYLTVSVPAWSGLLTLTSLSLLREWDRNIRLYHGCHLF